MRFKFPEIAPYLPLRDIYTCFARGGVHFRSTYWVGRPQLWYFRPAVVRCGPWWRAWLPHHQPARSAPLACPEHVPEFLKVLGICTSICNIYNIYIKNLIVSLMSKVSSCPRCPKFERDLQCNFISACMLFRDQIRSISESLRISNDNRSWSGRKSSGEAAAVAFNDDGEVREAAVGGAQGVH